MRWTKFLGFVAGIMLAASSTVVAQTGPTFPTTPPATAGIGDIRDGTVGSGTSINPSATVDRGKPRTTTRDGIEIILPGTDPAAGR